VQFGNTYTRHCQNMTRDQEGATIQSRSCVQKMQHALCANFTHLYRRRGLFLIHLQTQAQFLYSNSSQLSSDPPAPMRAGKVKGLGQ
jgi:hypothetical protein